MNTSGNEDFEVCNRSVARRFLNALGGGTFTFQTFDDNTTRRASSLARVLHGTIDRHLVALEDLNKRGAGVFATINRTDGKGRGRDNVIGIRAVFVDLDGAPLEPVTRWALPPHIVVESSPGRYHAYWLVDGTIALTEFTGLQKKLAKLFGGDPKVHDLSRVLRLPGFMHRKGDPFRTRIVRESVTLPRYSYCELVTALADVRVNEAPRGTRTEGTAIEPDRPGNIQAAIRYLQAEATPAIAFQQGNNQTYETACFVRGHFGLSEMTCYDLMVQHFNPRCDPPWSLDELQAIVRNAYAYAQGPIGGDSAEAAFASDPLPSSTHMQGRASVTAREPYRRTSRQRVLRRRRAREFMS